MLSPFEPVSNVWIRTTTKLSYSVLTLFPKYDSYSWLLSLLLLNACYCNYDIHTFMNVGFDSAWHTRKIVTPIIIVIVIIIILHEWSATAIVKENNQWHLLGKSYCSEMPIDCMWKCRPAYKKVWCWLYVCISGSTALTQGKLCTIDIV